MRKSGGLSLLEILISLAILAGAILIVFGVMAHGLIGIKKGENYAIASNIALAQFEVYKDRFHMIPFHPGKSVGSYRYPDRENNIDPSQAGSFIHHTANTTVLPVIPGGYKGTDDFYHDSAYDLNQDTFCNDIIEPMAPVRVEHVTFIPVVEIKSWSNGFNINEIKHIIVTVYWEERDAEGVRSSTKKVVFQGFIARTQPDPW